MLWGLLSDRFGRRLILLMGLALYGAGALGSGLAQNMTGLLAMRFVWGLGAASPSVTRLAIARDLYSGDQMARVISFMMAIFLLGPAVAPTVSEGILLLGDWGLLCFSAIPLAALAAIWTVRFGETLPPSNRRPIDLRATGRGVRAVLHTRVTIGYTLASMFTFGAFFIYLGSSPPIIDEIYGYDAYFALIFGSSSLFLAAAVFTSGRFTSRYGAENILRSALLAILIISAAFAVFSLIADGVPSFWIWFAATGLLGAFTTIFSPTASAIAMEPMQRIAGAASGVFGVITIGGGSILGSLIDRLIDDTFTPMAVGNLLYTAIAISFALWAHGGSRAVVDPEARPRPSGP